MKIMSLAPSANTRKHWALIAAGSKGWFDYRHQANVCHAYQILHKNGIPDENIVVMMYDDIASNNKNPTPGVIINKPNGDNVYEGVPKDYTKEAVTAKNFLNILNGNKQAMSGIGSGKVIDSGPNDHVFVFLVGHGYHCVLDFPSDMLMAHDLIAALNEMYDNKKFSKLVFYFEACKSGSMFHGKLKDNIKIYATTAANPEESSYACYYDKQRQTFLGDVYSVKWMENSDAVDLTKETLIKQFQIVKEETDTSHVMQYGDMDFANDVLDDFHGNGMGVGSGKSPEKYHGEQITDGTSAQDVELTILRRRNEDSVSSIEKEKIAREIEELVKQKEVFRKTMESIVERCTSSEKQKIWVLNNRANTTDFDCYKKVVLKFCDILGKHEHALRHVSALFNLCAENIPADTIVAAIKHVWCNLIGKEHTPSSNS